MKKETKNILKTYLPVFFMFLLALYSFFVEPNITYAKYFIGNSYFAPVLTEQTKIYNVAFGFKCRNN